MAKCCYNNNQWLRLDTYIDSLSFVLKIVNDDDDGNFISKNGTQH